MIVYVLALARPPIEVNALRRCDPTALRNQLSEALMLLVITPKLRAKCLESQIQQGRSSCLLRHRITHPLLSMAMTVITAYAMASDALHTQDSPQ